MGRRALPKIDPNVYLGDHLKTVDDLEPMLDPKSFFSDSGPIELEVGSGKGLFLCSASKRSPDSRFIGIELARKYAKFAAFRLAKQGADNALMIQGDALKVTNELLVENCLAAVHVYFPDPWWKARHRKRRVMNDLFLNNVARILVDRGVLHFWTDVQEYFDESLELLKGHVRLEGPHDVEERLPEHTLDYRTHFERRMREHNRPIYRAEYVRVSRADEQPSMKHDDPNRQGE